MSKMRRGKILNRSGASVLAEEICQVPLENKLYHLVVMLAVSQPSDRPVHDEAVKRPSFTRNPYLFGTLPGWMYVLHG